MSKCKFYLYKNKKILVDVEDINRVCCYTWSINSKGYVTARIGDKSIKLHRFIMNPSSDEIIDHINNDKTDNRKCNLRIIEQGHNKMRSPKNKGVYFRESTCKWLAGIRWKHKQIFLGSFYTRKEARRAYLTKRKQLIGE